MADIHNDYSGATISFEAGSTQNGDVSITGGTFNQYPLAAQDDGKGVSLALGSPVHLSDARGVKIDFIRILNAWYETGRAKGPEGGRITKKDFFTAMGRAVNMDLSDYDKHLSRAFTDNTSVEKQTRIFDELKEKTIEIWNSK